MLCFCYFGMLFPILTTKEEILRVDVYIILTQSEIMTSETEIWPDGMKQTLFK